MEQRVARIKQIEPYFKIADEEALKSPCTRRRYGAVIVDIGPYIYHTPAHNARVATCCNNTCIRDTMNFENGGNVEYGAEVHAETAALIDHGRREGTDRVMVLVGYKGAHELLSRDVWPCRVCALNLRYAGFKYIYTRDNKGEIVPTSIAEVIEYREAEWEPDN